jgi:DNA-binding Lrp family transcriptional regulator
MGHVAGARGGTDPQAKIKELVKAIGEFGPDISRIAEGIGIHKETARYWYKNKLLAKGFAVQAAVAYERLGLRYLVMVVDLEDDFEERAKPIFRLMSEICYVRYYSRTLPNGEYIVHAIVPEEHVEDYKAFLRELRSKGVFRSVEVFAADWHRNVPMRADYFDFQRGAWDFDWENLALKYNEKDQVKPQGRASFDRLDLEILKELQLDASTSLKTIAKKVGSNTKTAYYHYWKHILGGGLIRNYRMNWLGTRYDYGLDKAMHRRHRQLLLNLLATGLTENERMEMRAGMNRFPCLWAEAVGEGFYCAEVALPSESAAEGYAALAKVLVGVKRKYSVRIVDPTDAIGFTINPKLYDSAERAWQFRGEEVLEKLEGLVLDARRTS